MRVIKAKTKQEYLTVRFCVLWCPWEFSLFFLNILIRCGGLELK